MKKLYEAPAIDMLIIEPVVMIYMDMRAIRLDLYGNSNSAGALHRVCKSLLAQVYAIDSCGIQYLLYRIHPCM